jgi:hypothetical protein
VDLTGAVNFFRKESICCFTGDMDWSPEWAIQEMLEIFEKLEVPLTLFITHNSEIIKKRYGKRGKSQYVGLHPNFLPNSSHGSNYIEQIDFCQKLWPDAKCFRSHACFDNYLITKEFYARGFRYDSNLCLFLQPNCTPLHHCSGLIRFPIYWEDDVHSEKGLPFKIDVTRKHLDLAGLKVFNFHPLNLTLNTPTTEYYFKHKFLYQKLDADWRKYAFEGIGERRFLEGVISYFRKKEMRFLYIDDLFNELPKLG